MSSNNVHFGENLPNLVSAAATDLVSVAIRGNHWDYEQRIKQKNSGNLTAEKRWDYFEKAHEFVESCGCYSNYQVVKGLPNGGVFTDRYGYDMQDSIFHCMTDFYAGKISQSDVRDYFEECCVSMRIYRTQQCQTSGYNVTDNQLIVSQIYENFAKMNARAAQNANYDEGLAENQTYGGKSDDWVYYNSHYYYQCEETKELLQSVVWNMAEKWELPAIDTEDIEKNAIYTLDGGFDYNSGWNWLYRNQVGRGSMEDESVEPPKEFRFFYKQNSFDGTLWVSLNGDRKDINVPFSISPDTIKGQIYRVYDLMDDTFRAENKKDSKFLSGFTVFMRQYALGTGINNIFGNHVPQFE